MIINIHSFQIITIIDWFLKMCGFCGFDNWTLGTAHTRSFRFFESEINRLKK